MMHLEHERFEQMDAKDTPTGTEALVCADIAARQKAGIAKYGTTVEENPLKLREWMQHAYEECLDQAVYLRRIMQEMDKIPEVKTAEYVHYQHQGLDGGRIAPSASISNCPLCGEFRGHGHDCGWIQWTGGDCPVNARDYVYYKMRDGSPDSGRAENLNWSHDESGDDIIAYRVVKP